MTCCTDNHNWCDTCLYSHDGDATCYSPMIREDPPKDAEWKPKEKRALKDGE